MSDHTLTLTLVLPAPEFDGILTYHGPRTTDLSNAFDGAECGGGAIIERTPPVVVGSAPLPEFVDTALAFPMPELNDQGWPVADTGDISLVNPKRISAPSHVDRILVGGRDIRWFRATGPGDSPTEMPGYTLIEPFGYGASGTLIIPRTHSLFERYGQGDLHWLHQGATVRYQRVYDPGGEDQEIVTDYRGVVLAILTDEQEFRVNIGGEISARVGLAYKPPVKFRKVYDLGSLMASACETFGIRLFPPGGPDTGLTAPNEGGMDFDAWMSKIGALTRTASSQQRALMPTVWGGPRYGFEEKNTTDKHVTIHLDGTTAAAQMVDDVAEQHTGVYGTGTTPEGEKFDGTKWPGIIQGPPPAYPNTDNRDITIGDTDADTDSKFGVTALRHKLAYDGLIADSASNGTTYDTRVANAVKALQEAAGQTVNGVMNPAAWAALWNTDVVGFSLEGGRVFPLAQATWVQNYLYSAGGDIIGRNPNHIPGSIRVDVAYDYDVAEEESARNHARRDIKQSYGHQWAGTITLNQIHALAGVVHDSDIDTLTSANLMRNRDIRPGMNVWLPHFDGGTLVHVSQAQVNPGDAGDSVTLTVDTGARDIFDLSQALKRNRESRRSPFRSWIRSNQGIKPSGRLTPHDRYFGKLYQDVRIRGGRWNQFAVVLGQQGTVGRTDILLQNLATEYCVVVFARKIDPARLQKLVGNPFQLDDNGQTAWEHQSTQFLQDKRVMLYLVGEGQQPAGYGWKKGYFIDTDGTLKRTPNPLTGQHLDDSSWPYVTAPSTSPLGWVAIYPRRSATVRRGRLFYALEDDVT